MSSPILTQIFELEEWHHPNVVDDDNRPSGPEAFQQLAPVLATGNLRGLHLIATSRSTANAAPGFVNPCTGNVAAECSPSRLRKHLRAAGITVDKPGHQKMQRT